MPKTSNPFEGSITVQNQLEEASLNGDLIELNGLLDHVSLSDVPVGFGYLVKLCVVQEQITVIDKILKL